MAKFFKSLFLILVTIIVVLVGLFYLDGYLQTIKSETMITLAASAVDADCPGEVCTVLKVDSVSDPAFAYLKGKIVYPYNKKNEFNVENRILELSENGQHKLCAMGYPHKYYIGFLRYFVVGHGGYRMDLVKLERQSTSGCQTN